MKTALLSGFIVCLMLLNGSLVLGVEAFFDIVRTGTPKDVREAIQSGAEVNGRNEAGMTPLMWAAWYQTPEIIALLLEAGADGTLKSNEGKTAFDYTEYNVFIEGTDIYQLLEQAQ